MSKGIMNQPVGPGDHALGPAGAPVRLVEYGDYECPHCGRRVRRGAAPGGAPGLHWLRGRSRGK